MSYKRPQFNAILNSENILRRYHLPPLDIRFRGLELNEDFLLIGHFIFGY
ncbi:hypothetical protein T4D_15640 [Trichinella pseudospiralis]|uniref:Uncharacterized protein n=1 Tax=Trichinella pseudospiralis TaxID=6337 RepID=A0A0V1DQH7_TRIPS|nr:hypothetical protein T4D_15640 [Trichinella pseudospiralis]